MFTPREVERVFLYAGAFAATTLVLAAGTHSSRYLENFQSSIGRADLPLCADMLNGIESLFSHADGRRPTTVGSSSP